MQRRGIALIVGGALLAGCYATGVKVGQERLAHFVEGQTTCAEIVQELGPPTAETLRSDKSRDLLYAYTQSQINPVSFAPFANYFLSSSSQEQTTVTIACDPRGVLISYTSTQGQNTTGTGFLSGGKQR